MRKPAAYIIVAICSFFALARAHFLPQKNISTNQPIKVISSRTMSLDDRYSNTFVNDVFKDNILLTLQYMDGKAKTQNVDWKGVEKPFQFELELQPNKVFAFHDAVLPEYQGNVVQTTHSHFNGAEGFKSDGFLVGDGVCHLASLMNWVARDADLEVTARVNHDFAHIPEVPREYGTSIMTPDANQNLYIKNTFKKPVVLRFDYDGSNLTVSVAKSNDILARH
jgi:hypothetical protein